MTGAKDNGFRDADDHAEEARSSEQELRAIFDQAPLGMAIIDSLTGKFLKINQQYCKITGYSEGEMLDRAFQDITHPDDIERDIANMQRLREGELPGFQMDRRFIRKDGSLVWVRLTCVPLWETSRTRTKMSHIAMVEDITAGREAQARLAESERKYRELVECANSIIIRWTREGRITFLNEFGQRFFGYSGEEVIGRHVMDTIVPPSDAYGRDLRQLMNQICANPVAFEQNVNENMRRSGERVWIAWTNKVIKDDQGQVLEIFSVGTDITQLKKAEEAIRELNTNLERRVAERTALAETRAAQLRELAAKLTQTEQKERRRAAHILHEHVQQLLFAARLRLEQLKDQLKDESLAHIVDDVENIMVESIEASKSLAVELYPPVLYSLGFLPALMWLATRMKSKYGLQVDLVLDPECEPATDAVKTLLFDSTSELLFNVAKHAKVKTADVSAKRLCNQVEITVSDKGVGFDVTRQRMQGGTAGAFGLFSIREQLDLVGGRLEIESSPGRGSRFTITMPLGRRTQTQRSIDSPGVSVNAPGLSPVLRVHDTGDKSQSKIRVMVVDDHTIVRQGIALVLKGAQDMEIVGEAPDGKTAVELVDKILPDVVLMDINMPEMNGIDATGIIHQKHPDIRVIGLSMFEKGEQSDAMLQAGASAYLTKTGDFEVLLETIRNWAVSSML